MNDLDGWIEGLKRGELLSAHAARFVCSKVTEILLKESNVRSVQAPVTVVGDIHGQFYDVLEMFKVAGECPYVNYLFLGDYVDRGLFSLETISYLACLKLRYPDRVTMIRGNHESRQTTMVYGFYNECLSKYGRADVWQWFTDMFDYLPLAAVVEGPHGSIFATHGGLSPSLHTLDHIRVLDRFGEIPTEGPMCDLMWGDPDPDRDGFKASPRGAGFTFGKDVVEHFMHLNNLNYIVRAHQLAQAGYLVHWDCFATVWSAPNYCYRMGNLASVCEISEHHEKFFNVFDAAPKNERKVLKDFADRLKPSFYIHSNTIDQEQEQEEGDEGEGASPKSLREAIDTVPL